jgi:LRR receptor-like serine/threonine-protein kinase FLS2
VIEGFSANNLLGERSFGSVYQGTLFEGMIVAIKVFNLVVEGAFKSFDTECEVLMWSFVYQNISIIKLPLAIVRILIG